jgi:hypothetical protein
VAKTPRKTADWRAELVRRQAALEGAPTPEEIEAAAAELLPGRVGVYCRVEWMAAAGASGELLAWDVRLLTSTAITLTELRAAIGRAFDRPKKTRDD